MVDEHYTLEPGEPWADEHLLPAEKILLAAAKVGKPAAIRTDLEDPSEGEWPAFTKDHEIRAKLIRHMLIDPDAYQLDPSGFTIIGAHLTGTLNLENLTFELILAFRSCLFDNAPLLSFVHSRTLAFCSCRLPGLKADGLQIEGGLFLQKSVCTRGVRLLGVKVNGPVDCTDAIFINQGEYALNADGISVKGYLSLKRVTIKGGTHLLGANVTGDINCLEARFTHSGGTALNACKVLVEGSMALNGATITGETCLLSANINGNLECRNATFNNAAGLALNAQRMCVKASWIWELKTLIKGRVDLNQASVGDFVEDGSGWPEKGKLYIDGFRYDNLILPTTAEQRIRWLKLMPQIGSDNMPIFYPQPYEQLIKVFKAAGHERDARDIAIAKQDAYRAYLRLKAKQTVIHINPDCSEHKYYLPKEGRLLHRFWLTFLKFLIGYGYKPHRAVVGMFMALFFGAYVFSTAYESGLMEPAKERIYTHPCYIAKLEGCKHWGAIKHTAKNGDLRYVPPDYPDFNAFMYSLDVFVPFVDLKLENHWMPSARSMVRRWYFWLHIILGWGLTTIAVLGFTGLIKKD